MQNVLQIKLVFALIYICWMATGKSLKKEDWHQQKYIALQESVSTGLVVTVKCYLLVLVLMVICETCLWKRCRERLCLRVLCPHPAFMSHIL